MPDGWTADMIKAAMNEALENPSYAFSGLPDVVKAAIVNSYDSACHAVFGFLIATAVCIMTAIFNTEENSLT
ncbi:hypothetical protein DAMA08_031330 [Martiniozyma asiatica (nom. inval.)]|nr:hypothetical protein DAMA08_031330 [Martiniozyma asiatica]